MLLLGLVARPRAAARQAILVLGWLVKPDIPDLTSRDPGDGRGCPITSGGRRSPVGALGHGYGR